MAKVVRLKIRNCYKIWVTFDQSECLLVGMSNYFRDFGLIGGETLVFEYRDRQCFKVYIIGRHGAEIQYPSIVHASQTCSPKTVLLRPEGWKFIKSMYCTEVIVDEVVPPRSFLVDFAPTMPTRVRYLLNNGNRFPGYYYRLDRTLSGLGGICGALGVQNLNSFDILVFTYDGIRGFTVSLFDGRNVDTIFDEHVLLSGRLSESLHRPPQFVVEVKPFHMLSYCHGVDVGVEFCNLSEMWSRRDHITVYKDDHSWNLRLGNDLTGSG